MPVDIIYETHSTSTHNEAHIASGWLPGELSETGRGQARELGERHRDDDIATVYCSDLTRAVETAEIAFGSTAIPIVQDVRLRECNYGDMNGTAVDVLAAERFSRIDVPFPTGQSYRDVVDQTAAFLAEVAAHHEGQQVLFISHSANRWALQCLLEGSRLEELVDAPFDWQPGWRFVLPSGYGR